MAVVKPVIRHAGSCVTVTETVLTTDGCPICETMPSQWKALCEWLARHGIGARDVVLKMTIVRDVEKRQVIYTGFRRFRSQMVLFDAASTDPPSDADLERGVDVSEYREPEIQKLTVAVQLEAPPMPFPAELEAGRWVRDLGPMESGDDR